MSFFLSEKLIKRIILRYISLISRPSGNMILHYLLNLGQKTQDMQMEKNSMSLEVGWIKLIWKEN